jgi:hypothetical protein
LEKILHQRNQFLPPKSDGDKKWGSPAKSPKPHPEFLGPQKKDPKILFDDFGNS